MQNRQGRDWLRRCASSLIGVTHSVTWPTSTGQPALGTAAFLRSRNPPDTPFVLAQTPCSPATWQGSKTLAVCQTLGLCHEQHLERTIHHRRPRAESHGNKDAMTDATVPELYPQYCFQLSPTINRWCHFRISDILALRSHPGFQGQNVYFHLNHPIKWVRISGIVVAVDERERRHFYIIDDGSGATLECVVDVAPRAASGTASAEGAMNPASNDDSNTVPKIDGPIDVGHVLDIKGSVGTFRENKQIRAEKIAHLRSTEQEVAFWEKVVQLEGDVLSKPWALDRREVRRCRRAEEGRHSGRSHRRAREAREGKPVRKTGLEKRRKTLGDNARADHGQSESKSQQERQPLAKQPAKLTGLEKRRATKPVTRLIPVPGKYDALGL